MSAPKILPGANDHEKLQALAKLTYKQQAVWFLNSFWEIGEKDAETLWKFVHTCSDLDLQDHAEGCGLDEVNAHRFLEVYGETLTVRELRGKLRSTGALEESERPKVVPLTHFLLFKYNVDWHVLVNASQGDNAKEIEKAQQLLNEVQAAFRESDEKHKAAASSFRAAEKSASEAAAREASAKASEAAAVAKEEEAIRQEAPFKAAQEELETALAEVKKQEDEYQGKIDDCLKRSEDGGVVQRNKAKAELAQLQAEDPLPLQRAKITLEAARKRAEKARAPFDAATKVAQEARAVAQADAQQASQARQAADAARAESERAKIVAEQAVEEAKRRVKEAEDYLDEIKKQPGCAHGALWWIDRELHDAKAYVPESKGGYRK
jgi:DNA repair exonuclease SbcCD ATPase subunit